MRVDYTCGCQGITGTCGHRGYIYQDAEVVIEVPLNDETYIYINGIYTQEGYVIVLLNGVEYRFYLEEFKGRFKKWIKDDTEKKRSKYFLAESCWTYREKADARYHNSIDCHVEYGILMCSVDCSKINTDEFTEEHLSKCIRIDEDMNLPTTEKERVERKIEELKEEMNNIQEQLNKLEQKLTTLE